MPALGAQNHWDFALLADLLRAALNEQPCCLAIAFDLFAAETTAFVVAFAGREQIDRQSVPSENTAHVSLRGLFAPFGRRLFRLKMPRLPPVGLLLNLMLIHPLYDLRLHLRQEHLADHAADWMTNSHQSLAE